jgi:predicted Holliday junction resolvase-like endonuclease
MSKRNTKLSNSKREARDIIDVLLKGNFYAECPHCNETIDLNYACLFYLDDFPPEAEVLYQSKLEELEKRRKSLCEMPMKIARTSETGAKATNIGLILERIAPSMNSFPFDRNDCRSLFDPIDYIVFEGLSKKSIVDRVVFVEIKTGKSRLTARQQEVRFLVEQKRVYWSIYETGEGK